MDTDEKEFKRPEINLADECGRFKVNKFDFQYQYCHLCFSRFTGLLPFLQESARVKWGCCTFEDFENECEANFRAKTESGGRIPIVKELKDIKIDVECVVIGLVTKEMKKRPTILDEYLQDIYNSSSEGDGEDYMSEDDKIYIEDSSSRVPLLIDSSIIESKISAKELLSGTVIALRGHQISCGDFLVKDYAFSIVPENILIRENNLIDSTLPVYVGFISGMSIGQDKENSLSLQLLRDFILGVGAFNDEQKFVSSRISQLIIAGNSIQLLDTAEETNTGTGTKLIVNSQVLSKRLQIFDSFISQLASCVSVAIMPGDEDPVPISLPQPPFQPYIFKHAKKYQSLVSFTNPCLFRVNNVRISGISGKTISKISFYTSYKDPIEALKFCILSRNLAPACPDVIPCYPFSNYDPFILDYRDKEFPHVIFAGNQPKFDSYKFPNDGPACFTIPNFSANPSIVLLDINSFEIKTITFN
ncbi:DNA polymerase delta2 [Cryptosporidium ryanae]|uniref:DNA polymerase delta2 n=1 Tax=Cryptosporidium ryanae TaxID=515981 RepID=UPI00351A4A1E|nr:DNA polymerase delta2 [Cryptosporidium ryanae]